MMLYSIYEIMEISSGMILYGYEFWSHVKFIIVRMPNISPQTASREVWRGVIVSGKILAFKPGIAPSPWRLVNFLAAFITLWLYKYYITIIKSTLAPAVNCKRTNMCRSYLKSFVVVIADKNLAFIHSQYYAVWWHLETGFRASVMKLSWIFGNDHVQHGDIWPSLQEILWCYVYYELRCYKGNSDTMILFIPLSLWVTVTTCI